MVYSQHSQNKLHSVSSSRPYLFSIGPPGSLANVAFEYSYKLVGVALHDCNINFGDKIFARKSVPFSGWCNLQSSRPLVKNHLIFVHHTTKIPEYKISRKFPEYYLMIAAKLLDNNNG